MREYLRIRKAMSLFLAAYFIGGLLTLRLQEMEVFPVYSWFLFALAPSGGPQYGLLLHEVNGRVLDAPRLYQEADETIPTAHSVTVFKLTQEFGNAYEQKKASQKQYQESLEKNWLPPQTRYELVKFNGDPIARWKNKRYEITQRLQTFTNAEAKK